MLAFAYSDTPPEKYTDYRNRVFDKHLNKIKNQLAQIRQCSLRQEDKVKLKQQLLSLINS